MGVGAGVRVLALHAANRFPRVEVVDGGLPTPPAADGRALPDALHSEDGEGGAGVDVVQVALDLAGADREGRTGDFSEGGVEEEERGVVADEQNPLGVPGVAGTGGQVPLPGGGAAVAQFGVVLGRGGPVCPEQAQPEKGRRGNEETCMRHGTLLLTWEGRSEATPGSAGDPIPTLSAGSDVTSSAIRVPPNEQAQPPRPPPH